MIGAITTGNSFRKLFNYLLRDSKKPEILGGNYTGNTPKELAEIFNAVAAQRATTKKPVKHLVISFAPEDGVVSYEKKIKIAMETVHSLGYDNNQWVAIQHNRDDPDHYEKHDHDHIHIAINMVSYEGKRISDSFDKWRMQKILRELEIKYQLKRVISSLFRDRRRPKQSRYKKFEKAYYKYVDQAENFIKNKSDTVPEPPREPEIQELESMILAASDDNPTMSQFLARMQYLGYKVEEYEGKVNKRTGKPRKRFRYHLKSNNKPIYKIKGGSRAQLLKRVRYEAKRDDPNIHKAAQGIAINIADFQPVTVEMMQKYQYGWLSKKKQAQLKTSNLLVRNELISKEKNLTDYKKPNILESIEPMLMKNEETNSSIEDFER